LHLQLPDALVCLVHHVFIQVLHNRGLRDT